MKRADRPSASGGFTLVEVVIVATLLSLAMSIISMCLSTATASLGVDDLVARSMETLQRNAVRIAQITRPCAISTYRVLSTSADVPLHAAAAGEWMEPLQDDPRPSVQFRSARGELSMNAAGLTAPRTLRIQLDPGEVENGIDDDGDGMIDEGRVMLRYDGVDVAMAQNIERCVFTLSGRLLTIEMRSAARRRDGGLQRFTVRETIYLRNN